MNIEKPVIYHNPSCSKSRETLQILEHNNVEPTIIEYLEQPPSAQDLRAIIAMLGISARDLLRTTEQVYKDAQLDDESLTEDDIIEAICQYPALLQRPIVVADGKAIIGRPPVKVLDILA